MRLVATHSRRAVLHLVEGTPDDGPADTTLDRVHGLEFWREPKEKLRRLLVEQRRLQRWITMIVKYIYCIARYTK